MLKKLSIKNVALIESAEISFSRGLNVLSGETGAGKSVILDSLNFVLGAKADKTMIRHGETECLVKAEFFVSEGSKALEELRDLDVESDGDIIISRRFSEGGKSSIKINGNTVTAAMLRRVTDCLVDVHGQSEHFYLLSENNQLKTLDGVTGEALLPEKQALFELLAHKKKIKERISLLGGDEKERGRRLDILRFQIDEITKAELKDGEEEELLSKRNKINNLEKIISALREASSALTGDGGAIDAVRTAKRAVSAVSLLDGAYAALFERLENLSIEAEDVAETLSDCSDGLYFDEEDAARTEERLDEIRALKRKYGANKAEIDEYLSKIQAEYDLLSDCEGQYAALTADAERTDKKIYAVCREITALRKESAKKFSKHVTEELKTLNIGSAKFEIVFNDYALEDVDKATHSGADSVCFMFSANAGEPLKPLGKIISGGEMSRFMLAIKTGLSDVNGISTYVFDEIDAGISGKTAKVVGEKFARIAKNTQIVAVSHLAQIAAMSDSEFLIEKQEEGGKTLTHVRALNEREKTEEIVRLLGGDKGDEFAVRHAEELIKQAKEYKTDIN